MSSGLYSDSLHTLGQPSAASHARRLWLLGTLRFATDLADREGRVLPGERLRCLLAFLALNAGRPYPREYLAELLWPKAPAERSRRNLSDLLYRLQRTLGEGWLSVGDEHIACRVVPEGPWIDVVAFDELASSQSEDGCRAAVALYKDDLLLDLYEDWAVPLRERLRERFLNCLAELGRSAEAEERLDQAFEFYHRLSYEDPLREQGHLGLMRTLTKMGRPIEALAAGRRLEQVLDAELGILPGTAARKLILGIEADLSARGSSLALDTRPWPDLGATMHSPPPFVGRIEERAMLSGHLSRAATGRGGVALLTGPAGIGKSRLAGELAAAAAQAGWQVGWGRGDAEAGGSAFAPLDSAIAALIRKPERAESLAEALPPLWLALASRVCPSIGAGRELPEPRLPALAPAQMARSLHRSLAVLSRSSPILLILDDVQSADASAWDLIAPLAASIHDLPVLLLCIGRVAENAEPLWAEFEAQEIASIALSGLPASEVRALAAAAGPGKGLMPMEAAERLTAISEGNPLVVLECLEADSGLGTVLDLEGTATEGVAQAENPGLDGQDSRSGKADHLLSALIDRRLARLDAEPRRAMEAASCLGPSFETRIWADCLRACGISGVDALRVQLYEADVLRAEPARAGREGGELLRFAHEVLQQRLHSRLEAVDRVAWHRRAFEAYTRLAPERTRTRLHHARQAELGDERVALALQAGDEARRAMAPSAALEFYDEALDHLASNALEARSRALLGRCRARHWTAEREAQHKDLDALGRLVGQGSARMRAEFSLAAAQVAVSEGRLEDAEQFCEQGLAEAETAEARGLRAQLQEQMAFVRRDQGDLQGAESCVRAAYEGFRSEGDRFREAAALDKLASLDYARGRSKQAEARHREAAELFESVGASVYAANARSGCAQILRDRGETDAARSLFEAARETMREHGLPVNELSFLINLGNLSLQVGDLLAGIEFYEAAVESARSLDQPRYLAMALNNLGNPYREIGDDAMALRCHGEALSINERHGFQLGAAYARYGLGEAHVAAGRPAEAISEIESAVEGFNRAGARGPIAGVYAALSRAYLLQDAVEDASVAVDRALAIDAENAGRESQRQHVAFAAHLVRRAEGRDPEAREHLDAAKLAMMHQASRLPASDRLAFLQRPEANVELLATLSEERETTLVKLVARDTPLGRALVVGDYREVEWTLAAPEDEAFPEPALRRQHVLTRLLDEAGAQGAAPTDADLAEALGVSRRTVLRDAKVLESMGIRLPTRRRLRAR